MEDLKSGIEHLKQAKAHMSKANGIMSDSISKLKELEEENAGLKAEIAIIQPEDAYMKLPLDVDGAAIHVGDAVYFESEVAKVCGMRWDGASWSLSLHDRAEDAASHCCRLVPTAALIGADGVSIGVGDIVYRDADPEPLQVDLIYAGSMGYCTVRLKNSAGIYTSADAPRLSHKKPEPLQPDPADSWEKLEKDAMGRACELAGSGPLRCGDCEWGKEDIGCQAMARLEILKRAKKLAGIEEAQR